MVVSCRQLMIVLFVLVLTVLSASVDSPATATSPSSSAVSSTSSPQAAPPSPPASSETQARPATETTSVPVAPHPTPARPLADTSSFPAASTVSRDTTSSLSQVTATVRTSSSTVSSSTASSPSSSPPSSTSAAATTARRRGDSVDQRPPHKRRERVTDKRVLQAVETSLLGKLGLKSRPRPVRTSSVPPYMLELYQRQASSQSPLSTIDSPFLQVKGRGSIAANTVRSFHHTDHHVDAGCNPRTCHRIIFNLTNIPSNEVLAAAELRLLLGLDAAQGHHGAKVNSFPCEGGKDLVCKETPRGDVARYRVEVHEIMQAVGGEEDCISRLIDTRLVQPGDPASWQSFDIQPAVLKWKKGPRYNHGLEIRLVTPSKRISTDTHVRVRRAAALPEDQWLAERPLLLTYTDDGRGPGPQDKSLRSKRSTNTKRKRRRRKSREGKTRRNRRNRKDKKKKRRKTKKGDKNMCRRHPLYVDFSDVGWNDWIVAPDGYNAYYCQGDCNFPLAHHLNSTNHAIVQTLVNSVDPSAVPKACCVPTELSAISMLYLDEWDKVVLKNYQDMVVEACGCR